ncbi:MAG TPA: hypothetical protein EYP35_04935 [Desulfobacterales bacterium]|nr:hypothetical protein [Desulfobacterales bacterium]
MNGEPVSPLTIYQTERNTHLQYLLDLWHSIGRDHAEFTKMVMLGSVDPEKFAELMAKVLELWKELIPFDPDLPDWNEIFRDPTRTLEEKIVWLNEAILHLSHSLKRLGITEFRDVQQ